MRIIKIKSLWQGTVGLRRHQIKERIDAGEALIITYKGDKMVIPNDKIRSSIIRKSEEAFVDKFSNQAEHLYYFSWQPAKENKLL